MDNQQKKNRWLPIVAEFSFCEDKVNILKDYEKLKNTTFSIFEDFPEETVRFTRKNSKKFLPIVKKL